MPFQQNDKPDSVPPKICIVPAVPIPNNWVASIINLHNVLPQSVKPPTRFRFGTNHRKPIWGCCTQRLPVSLKPFPICIVTVALIVRLLCPVNQPVCCPTQSGLSSDSVSAMLCLADAYILQQNRPDANIFCMADNVPKMAPNFQDKKIAFF